MGTIKISFCDFVHVGHACNTMPYGASLVAGYAKNIFGDKISVDIFKYTADFLHAFEQERPNMVCFSNYIWNTELTCEVAKRIKREYPDTVIVVGGPHYPVEESEQLMFLSEHPYIDFYVFKSGEEAFAGLLAKLIEKDMNISIIKNEHILLGNVSYVSNKTLFVGPLLPVTNNLDDIPSPYLTGLLKDFFEQGLTPITQTTRGCPYSCTYCQDGDEYASKVKRFSRERIDVELEYIAQHSKSPILMLGDLNFGMYKEDLDTCVTIARLRSQYGWPQNLDLNGKNKKDRILEAARIIDGDDLSGGAVTLVAAVQSTDPVVLKSIKRDNVSIDVMTDLAKEVAGTSSFSEVILCLPSDTKAAHFKSIFDLIECGVNVVRSHQFIMLPGSEAATTESRSKYGMQTRFRITPKTVMPFEIFGETVFAPEIDEICVANNTLSFEDYLDCRVFNLTVEIFYNYGIFHELLSLLRLYQISVATLISDIHKEIISKENSLSEIYAGFLRETNELFGSREELVNFFEQEGVAQRYMSGELGNNEQLMYRALAVFNHMDELHNVAYGVARKLLLGHINDQRISFYLDELYEFSLMRKKNLLDTKTRVSHKFNFAFDELLARNFCANPIDYIKENETYEIFHSAEQATLINGYIGTYGLDNYGLGNILGGQTNVNMFYRQVSKFNHSNIKE